MGTVFLDRSLMNMAFATLGATAKLAHIVEVLLLYSLLEEEIC